METKIFEGKSKEEILKILKEDKDYKIRAYAAESLGKFKEEDVIHILIDSAINDKSGTVQDSCVIGLTEIGENAIETIINEIRKAKDEKEYILRIMGEFIKKTEDNICFKKGVDEISKILKKDADESVREECVEILSDLENSEFTEILIEALNDTNEGVRREATCGLSKIGDERAILPLSQGLDDQGIKDVCMEAIKEIFEKEENWHVTDNTKHELYMSLINHINDNEIKEDIIDVLERIINRYPKNADEIMKLLGCDNKEIRSGAIEVLKRVTKKEIHKKLFEKFESINISEEEKFGIAVVLQNVKDLQIKQKVNEYFNSKIEIDEKDIKYNYNKNEVEELSKIDIVNDVGFGKTKGVEENVKIEIVVPFINFCGYNKPRDRSFEYGGADAVLMIKGKPKVIVEVKTPGDESDWGIDQAFGYADNYKAPYTLWINGRIFKLHRRWKNGIKIESNKPLVESTLEDLPKNFHKFYKFIGKENIEQSND